MFGKGNKFYGIVKAKCPRCHEGNMFENHSAYNLKHMTEIKDHCEVCGQTYEPEPNFYYGAMYVSYGFTVAIFVAAYIIGKVFLGLTIEWTIALLVGALLVLSPLVFRYSRVTYLHIMVKYRKDALENKITHEEK